MTKAINPLSLTPVQKKIMQDLCALIGKARIEHKWIYLVYQSCWFTPDDLEHAIRERRFIWHVQNFRLRDPFECLTELEAKIDFAKEEYNTFKKRIAEWQSKSK